eukprot:6045940-Amphidinium_carterae.3
MSVEALAEVSHWMPTEKSDSGLNDLTASYSQTKKMISSETTICTKSKRLSPTCSSGYTSSCFVEQVKYSRGDIIFVAGHLISETNDTIDKKVDQSAMLIKQCQR